MNTAAMLNTLLVLFTPAYIIVVAAILQEITNKNMVNCKKTVSLYWLTVSTAFYCIIVTSFAGDSILWPARIKTIVLLFMTIICWVLACSIMLRRWAALRKK
jgi:uncharacterized membrane protein